MIDGKLNNVGKKYRFYTGWILFANGNIVNTSLVERPLPKITLNHALF